MNKFEIEYVIPDYVEKVARMLLKEGHQAYLVGGALRDIVMGVAPDDYDLATDAKPEEMLKIFPKSVSVGVKFGMVIAQVPDRKGEIFDVEVMIFRSEEGYVSGRWPSKVTYVDSILEDLSRRDLTFNAMALDLSTNSLDSSGKPKKWEIIDPYNGARDILKRVVRAVGNPLERFQEDGLRTMRACRIASELQFNIEEETFSAIVEAIPVLKLVSIERVRDEFLKLLYRSPKPSYGIELLRKSGILEIYIPELAECYGVEQKKYHAHDVYWHSLKTCDLAPDRIKLAALFHDIAKPVKSTGDGHFYGHDVHGDKMVRDILKRLRFSRDEIERVASLVKNHMFFYPYESEDMSDEEKEKIREQEWSDSAVRRFIARVGEENLEDLFSLRIADAASNPKTAFRRDEIEQLQRRISEVQEKDNAFKISDLDINGDDIIGGLGISSGPIVGKILEYLFNIVLDDPLQNRKEILLDLAKDYVEKNSIQNVLSR
ncbi:MAG TPA: HD domain-containing protein [bacterium]|nr:HD domain-containing protein [bacterium]